MNKRHAAILAILATFTALIVTLPFATAYFKAYEPRAISAWMTTFALRFPQLLDFASRSRVYQIYGRIFSLAVPLTIPALLTLKDQIGVESRFSRWAWRILFGGVLLTGAGIFGDYWPPQDSFWIGVGFLCELIGILILGVGSLLTSATALRNKIMPRWIGFGLLGIVPVGVVGVMVLKHIPSGPLLGYMLFWLLQIRQLKTNYSSPLTTDPLYH